jgi:hypothetical protein
MTTALRLAAGSGIGAGMAGFLVVLGLIVIAVFLFLSMNRHLRKVPQSFEEPPAAEGAADASGDAGGDARPVYPSEDAPAQSSRD